jgi:nucleoside-diphosphate-sugar epimerase
MSGGAVAEAPTFDGCRILVAGGAGFIGSNLVDRLLRASSAELLIIDNLLSAEIDNVPSSDRVTFVHGSIAEDRFLAKIPPDVDYVFHLATYHGNQSSIHDPIADHDNNTLTTLKLCEHLRDFKRLRKLVYASAGCTVASKTFDEAAATTEEAGVSLYMDSPYQVSKIIGELYGNYYFLRHGLPFVKARFQNVYGPREILGAGQWRGTPATVWRNVVPTFIYKALAAEPLPVERGGTATRDFIFVGDIVDGLMRCALAGSAGGVYNLASGVETSILDLARLVNALTGNPASIEQRPARDWDRSGRRYGATEKSKDELGFIARIGLRQGLQATIEWTRDNLALIERCMARHRRFVEF